MVDVEENLMTQSPSNGLENHPAITVGHLVSAAALTSKYLGGSYEFNSEWEKLFRRKGPGDPRMRELNIALYPEKEHLLKELTNQHKLVEGLILKLDDRRFNEPTKWRFDRHMATRGDLLFFMCVTHESMHLGQLAGWRRAMGIPSALAILTGYSNSYDDHSWQEPAPRHSQSVNHN